MNKTYQSPATRTINLMSHFLKHLIYVNQCSLCNYFLSDVEIVNNDEFLVRYTNKDRKVMTVSLMLDSHYGPLMDLSTGIVALALQ